MLIKVDEIIINSEDILIVYGVVINILSIYKDPDRFKITQRLSSVFDSSDIDDSVKKIRGIINNIPNESAFSGLEVECFFSFGIKHVRGKRLQLSNKKFFEYKDKSSESSLYNKDLSKPDFFELKIRGLYKDVLSRREKLIRIWGGMNDNVVDI